MSARKVDRLEDVAFVVNQEIKQCAENIKAILENLPVEQRNDIKKLADSMKISDIGKTGLCADMMDLELGLRVEIDCQIQLISSVLKEQLKQQAKTIVEKENN